MKKIFFRTDMNETIATGHVMRCLSIADALKEKGCQTVFVTADAKSFELIHSRGYENIILNSSWDNLEEECSIISKVIREHQVDIVIVDSYYASAKYLKDISAMVKVVYIDDLMRNDLCIDTVLAYGIYASREQYLAHETNKICSCIIGTKYAPLRKEFQELSPKTINEEIQNGLVLSGGSDPYGTVEAVVDSLLTKGVDSVVAVCGRYSLFASRLKSKYSCNRKVRIYESVNNIEELMRNADICISAAGSTLYELCACGTPTLSYVLADNQIPNAKGFSERGIIEYLGDVREKKIETNIASHIEDLRDVLIRKKISERMQSVVDGKGCCRIADYLLENEDSNNYS